MDKGTMARRTQQLDHRSVLCRPFRQRCEAFFHGKEALIQARRASEWVWGDVRGPTRSRVELVFATSKCFTALPFGVSLVARTVTQGCAVWVLSYPNRSTLGCHRAVPSGLGPTGAQQNGNRPDPPNTLRSARFISPGSGSFRVTLFPYRPRYPKTERR